MPQLGSGRSGTVIRGGRMGIFRGEFCPEECAVTRSVNEENQRVLTAFCWPSLPLGRGHRCLANTVFCKGKAAGCVYVIIPATRSLSCKLKNQRNSTNCTCCSFKLPFLTVSCFYFLCLTFGTECPFFRTMSLASFSAFFSLSSAKFLMENNLHILYNIYL